jgi:hypothetical protein
MWRTSGGKERSTYDHRAGDVHRAAAAELAPETTAPIYADAFALIKSSGP